MPKFERPSAEAIALTREALERSHAGSPLEVWLYLVNKTDAMERVSKEDQGFLLGYALAVIDAEKSAQHTTLVSAPPSSLAPPEWAVDAQVANHVGGWLRRMAEEYWSDSDVSPRTLRIHVLKYSGRDDQPELAVEVEERPITDFSGPVSKAK